MHILRRIFRRDDTIDADRPLLDLEETRRFGMRDKASAYEAIARIKAEQVHVRRLRKLLERRSGLLTPKQVRSAVRWSGGQFAEMGLSSAMQSSDTTTMYGTQLQAIEQWERDAHALWLELERVTRT